MIDIINKRVKDWNWKNQTVGDFNIPQILHNIEVGYYQAKKVKINLDVIDLSVYKITTEDLFDFMVHYKLTQNADLNYPVILNRKGYIVDGRHRLCKAILEGKKYLDGIMILDSDII